MTTTAAAAAAADETAVRVALRVRQSVMEEELKVRPLLSSEQAQRCASIIGYPQPDQITCGERAFTFDHVIPGDGEQSEVYETCVEALVTSFLEGYNATCFAYGQTGGGKSYTMGTMPIGGEQDAAAAADAKVPAGTAASNSSVGIIPRVLRKIFRVIEDRRDQVDSTLRFSFIEIYNDEFRDLLASNTVRGTADKTPCIREDASGGVAVHNVVELPLQTFEDVMQQLAEGNKRRATGATNMNVHSSRSHAICTVFLTQRTKGKNRAASQRASKSSGGASRKRSKKAAGKGSIAGEDENASGREEDEDLMDEGGQILSSKFHFVDLAGSERLKRTGAVGARMREGININKGLLALGNVISALGDPERIGSHVPFRDSKITRMLQDSLGGNSRTLMIACISPADINYEESLNCLKYANRARNIKNKPVLNLDPVSAKLAKLRARILDLESALTGAGITLPASGKGASNGRLHGGFPSTAMAVQQLKSRSDRPSLITEMELNRIEQKSSVLRGENKRLKAKLKSLRAEISKLQDRVICAEFQRDDVSLKLERVREVAQKSAESVGNSGGLTPRGSQESNLAAAVLDATRVLDVDGDAAGKLGVIEQQNQIIGSLESKLRTKDLNLKEALDMVASYQELLTPEKKKRSKASERKKRRTGQQPATGCIKNGKWRLYAKPARPLPTESTGKTRSRAKSWAINPSADGGTDEVVDDLDEDGDSGIDVSFEINGEHVDDAEAPTAFDSAVKRDVDEGNDEDDDDNDGDGDDASDGVYSHGGSADSDDDFEVHHLHQLTALRRKDFETEMARLQRDQHTVDLDIGEKERLAQELTRSRSHALTIKRTFEQKVKAVEEQMEATRAERDAAMAALEQDKSATKEKHHRVLQKFKKRISELEDRLNNFRKKLKQSQASKKKQADDAAKLRRLQSEIDAAKRARVELTRKMKLKTDAHRAWVNSQDMKVKKLARDARKSKLLMQKMQRRFIKQSVALMRRNKEKRELERKLKDANSGGGLFGRPTAKMLQARKRRSSHQQASSVGGNNAQLQSGHRARNQRVDRDSFDGSQKTLAKVSTATRRNIGMGSNNAGGPTTPLAGSRRSSSLCGTISPLVDRGVHSDSEFAPEGALSSRGLASLTSIVDQELDRRILRWQQMTECKEAGRRVEKLRKRLRDMEACILNPPSSMTFQDLQAMKGQRRTVSDELTTWTERYTNLRRDMERGKADDAENSGTGGLTSDNRLGTSGTVDYHVFSKLKVSRVYQGKALIIHLMEQVMRLRREEFAGVRKQEVLNTKVTALTTQLADIKAAIVAKQASRLARRTRVKKQKRQRRAVLKHLQEATVAAATAVGSGSKKGQAKDAKSGSRRRKATRPKRKQSTADVIAAAAVPLPDANASSDDEEEEEEGEDDDEDVLVDDQDDDDDEEVTGDDKEAPKSAIGRRIPLHSSPPLKPKVSADDMETHGKKLLERLRRSHKRRVAVNAGVRNDGAAPFLYLRGGSHGGGDSSGGGAAQMVSSALPRIGSRPTGSAASNSSQIMADNLFADDIMNFDSVVNSASAAPTVSPLLADTMDLSSAATVAADVASSAAAGFNAFAEAERALSGPSSVTGAVHASRGVSGSSGTYAAGGVIVPRGVRIKRAVVVPSASSSTATVNADDVLNSARVVSSLNVQGRAAFPASEASEASSDARRRGQRSQQRAQYLSQGVVTRLTNARHYTGQHRQRHLSRVGGPSGVAAPSESSSLATAGPSSTGFGDNVGACEVDFDMRSGFGAFSGGDRDASSAQSNQQRR